MRGSWISKSLFVFCVCLLRLQALALESLPKVGSTINWDFPETHGFQHYQTYSDGRAYFDLIPNTTFSKSEKQYVHVFRNSSSKKNPLYNIKDTVAFYPLFGSGRVKGQKLVGRPLPEVTFYTSNRTPPTYLPDFMNLVHEDHFVWIPKGSKMILFEQPLENRFEVEFPIGTTFIHRLFLNNREQTPLELRFSQRREDGSWQFVAFDNPTGEQKTLRARHIRIGEIKEVPPFESLSYGKVSFKYTMTNDSDCLSCHQKGQAFNNTRNARLHSLYAYAGEVHSAGFNQWSQIYQAALRERKEIEAARKEVRMGVARGKKILKRDRPASELLFFHTDPVLESIGAARFGPCGFADERDVAPYRTANFKFAQNYFNENKQSPFVQEKFLACSSSQLRPGSIVHLKVIELYDPAYKNWIQFEIKYQTHPRTWIAEAIADSWGVSSTDIKPILELKETDGGIFSYKLISPEPMQNEIPIEGVNEQLYCRSIVDVLPPRP